MNPHERETAWKLAFETSNIKSAWNMAQSLFTFLVALPVLCFIWLIAFVCYTAWEKLSLIPLAWNETRKHFANVTGLFLAIVLLFALSVSAADPKPVVTRESLAEILYNGFKESAGLKDFRGNPLPDWKAIRDDEAKQPEVSAWLYVAKLAMENCDKRE